MEAGNTREYSQQEYQDILKSLAYKDPDKSYIVDNHSLKVVPGWQRVWQKGCSII